MLRAQIARCARDLRRTTRQDLDCDVAIQLRVAGAIHLPMPPAPRAERSRTAEGDSGLQKQQLRWLKLYAAGRSRAANNSPEFAGPRLSDTSGPRPRDSALRRLSTHRFNLFHHARILPPRILANVLFGVPFLEERRCMRGSLDASSFRSASSHHRSPTRDPRGRRRRPSPRGRVLDVFSQPTRGHLPESISSWFTRSLVSVTHAVSAALLLHGAELSDDVAASARDCLAILLAPEVHRVR